MPKSKTKYIKCPQIPTYIQNKSKNKNIFSLYLEHHNFK